MDLKRSFGYDPQSTAAALAEQRRGIRQYVRLRLVASGLSSQGGSLADAAAGLLASHQEQERLLLDHRCAADERIEDFLSAHLTDTGVRAKRWLPGRTLALDRHGMARELSLPANGDKYESAFVSSYRVANGVLHNPRNDRRTTGGTFHVAEGGLALPCSHKYAGLRTSPQPLS